MTDEQQQYDVKGPGAILQEARIKAGLSVAEIAKRLHLKQANIEAIEADNYDPKVSMTFTKGYLKLYAKQVNVPQDVVISALSAQNVEEKEPAKLQSFSKRVAKQANDDRLMLLTYLIVAVLVALIVIWWFQQDSSDTSSIQSPSMTSPATVEQPKQKVNEVVLPPTEHDLVVSAQRQNQPQSAPVAESLSLQAPDGNAQTPSSQFETAAEDNIAVSEEPTSGQSNEQPETVELVFVFSDDCWMNLSDATGEAIAYGVKKAGRVMTVSGVAPFEVTLGAPQYVQIQYDGVAVDMSRFDAGSTAKFNLPFSQ